MTFGVLIDTITTQEGRTQKIYKFLRLIESYKKMSNTLNDASVGYFLEIDLNYPVHLHDDNRHFPLAPNKDVVQDDWLGEYKIELRNITDYPARMLKNCFKRYSTKKLCIALQTSQVIR